MPSCHIAICYNKKTKQNSIINLKNLSEKSCETSYLYVGIANGITLWEIPEWALS